MYCHCRPTVDEAYGGHLRLAANQCDKILSVKIEQEMSGALREHTQSSEQLYSHAIKYSPVAHAVYVLVS